MDVGQKIALTGPGRLLLKAFFFLSQVPGTVQEANYWFYNISNLAYILITLLHLAWMGVFFAMGQLAVMYVQLASIALFIMAIALNRRGYHLAGMVVALLEVNTHQLIAVACFGWITGFQNFIPLIALMPFLKYNEKWASKIALWTGCMLFYLYIDFFVKNQPPLVELETANINFLNFSNTVVAFILVALWGIVLAVSYQRTVNELIRKELELAASQKASEQAEILQQLALKERDNEIHLLRNVALKQSYEEISLQKEQIEALVSEQEHVIALRTRELAMANGRLMHNNQLLVELIRHNAHNIREPLTRIMGAMLVAEYMSTDEFFDEIWPQMDKAANDLDRSIKEVIVMADEIIVLSNAQGNS